MKLELNNDTMKRLQEIAELKGISTNEVASKVLELYSRNYLNMVKGSIRSVENAIKRYDREK